MIDKEPVSGVEKLNAESLNPGSFNDFMEYCGTQGIGFESQLDAVNAHGQAIELYAEALAAEQGITVEQLRSGPFASSSTDSQELAA